jgi:hypothetical protein
MAAHRRTFRALALDLTSRGFGFVVLEGPAALVDWGVHQSRPYREDRCLRRVDALLAQYRPQVLVLEDARRKARRRSQRVDALFHGTAGLAGRAQVPVRLVGWDRVRRAFAPHGRITKYGISRAVARLLPELAGRLPPYRKPWMSEDYRMAIFDAAALALACRSGAWGPGPGVRERG